MRARDGVNEDEAELVLQALGNQNLRGGNGKEVTFEFFIEILLRGFDFTEQNLVQLGFNVFERIQIDVTS